MADRTTELRAILASVRAQWTRRALLRSWALGATTAAAMLAVGLLAVWLLAQEGLPLVIVVATTGLVAGVSLSFALLPLRRQPSDRQVARFIEEQAGDLDEVLVTAVDKSASSSGPVVELIVADAVRKARRLDLHALIARDTIRRATIGAVAGSIAFLVAFVFFAPSASRAIDVVGSYVFPAHYAIDVRPGSIKVREGQPVTITARIPGIDGGLVPMITVGDGAEARSARMTAAATPGQFSITLNNIARSFPYSVAAGAAKSPQYNVEVIRPVRVSRVDVTYEYAPGLGLQSHTEQDGGDIFAPAGTKVHLTITADKAVANGTLTVSDGESIALAGHNQVMTGDLTVAKDGSYRIALNDTDGLSNDGGTEYFIRMLDDRPPEVRILRPAGDKQVSPLEEVVLEARADDDYGVRSLELVIKPAAGKEAVVPLSPVNGSVATGSHTLYLEDLNVKPGDMVTYYARATDVGRGRRSTESRSDIFFLEVKPYEEEFVSAESQASGSLQGEQTGLEELIAQQKDIMAATWKLDARARRGGAGAQSSSDIKAIAAAQSTLQGKTAEAAAEIGAQLQAQRRRLAGPQGRTLTRPGDDPLPKAIDAMGRAAGELNRLRIAPALPYEEQALSELLKAAAEIRRRQLAMQQARNGGGNGNRNQPDLSTLFDQELRKRQATNYEQQSTTEDSKAGEEKKDDPIDAIRDLARRQEALSKQQRDLANGKDQMSAEEMKRQLEKLTRDQEKIQQEVQELSRQMQSGQQASRPAGQQKGQQASGSAGQQGSQSDQLRDVSEQMRQAAGDLRNQDPKQASARGSKAGEQLRNLEQQLQGASPDERKKALGDMQLEARQLADAQRKIGNDAAKASPGAAGEDARRKLAGEQERLADRAQRLSDSVKQLAGSQGQAKDQQGQQQAIGDAGRELDQQNVPGRMRESAQSLRQGQPTGNREPGTGNQSDQIAKTLDQVADRLGSARGDRDAEAAKLSDQLGKTQELRDRLDKLTRAIEGQQANGRTGQQAGQQASGQAGQQDIAKQLQEARQLAEELSKSSPDKQLGGTTPEQWERSFSAPGTEAFKQDFSKWESLKKNLQVALEQAETRLSEQLRARENRERLNAGRHDAVSDTYRDLVDRYYQSLAVPRRPSK